MNRVAMIALVSGWAGAAAAADGPYFTGLGHLPGGPWNDSQAVGVSADGRTVAGQSNSALGIEAFIWTRDGGIVGLGDLPGGPTGSYPADLSADGTTVVGFSFSQASADIHPNSHEAFRWTAADGMVGLGVSAKEWYTEAAAVSGDGSVIVGNTFFQGAFRWTADEKIVELPIPPEFVYSKVRGISDDGLRPVGDLTRVGFQDREAAVWDGGQVLALGDFPGGAVNSRAVDASADGRVVVGVGDANHQEGLNLADEAFRWTAEEGMVGLGDFPSDFFFSTAVAVSGDGSVVVGMGMAEDAQRPYIWEAQNGMRGLMTVLEEEYGLNFTGWQQFVITDMSADGRTFVGAAGNPGGEREAWIASMGDEIACYPDFTGDGALDLFDFLEYVNAFNGGDPDADCTGDGGLDLFDFLCYLNAFDAGC